MRWCDVCSSASQNQKHTLLRSSISAFSSVFMAYLHPPALTISYSMMRLQTQNNDHLQNDAESASLASPSQQALQPHRIRSQSSQLPAVLTLLSCDSTPGKLVHAAVGKALNVALHQLQLWSRAEVHNTLPYSASTRPLEKRCRAQMHVFPGAALTSARALHLLAIVQLHKVHKPMLS